MAIVIMLIARKHYLIEKNGCHFLKPADENLLEEQVHQKSCKLCNQLPGPISREFLS